MRSQEEKTSKFLDFLMNEIFCSVELSTALVQACDSNVFDDIDPENRTDCRNCASNLKLCIPSPDQFFYRCIHIYPVLKCKDLFEKVVTVCFAFNTLDIYRNSNGTNEENWTLEGGYRNYTSSIDVFPRSGSRSGLYVLMPVSPYMVDGICKGAIQGSKVYLHLPNEAPQISKHFVMMPHFYSTEISIIPKVINTAPELRDFPVEKRQCYFSDERYLRFFKHYTQNNCEIECLENLTLSRCGCLRFHMPGELSSLINTNHPCQSCLIKLRNTWVQVLWHWRQEMPTDDNSPKCRRKHHCEPEFRMPLLTDMHLYFI
jgi:acid-sensing ion channel, other